MEHIEASRNFSIDPSMNITTLFIR